MPTHTSLVSPGGSRVDSAEIFAEVAEYFDFELGLPPAPTVFDVGANVGAFTLRLAECCSAPLTVLCFEPAPPLFDALQANTKALGTGFDIRCFPVGLGRQAQAGEDLPFYYFSRYPTNSSFSLATKRQEFEAFFEFVGGNLSKKFAKIPGLGRLGSLSCRAVRKYPRTAFGWWTIGLVMGLKVISCKTSSLSAIINKEGIERVDLIKIDVEGLEYEVLAGLADHDWPKVDRIVLETNTIGGQARVISLLEERGFDRIEVKRQRVVDNGLDSVILFASRTDTSR